MMRRFFWLIIILLFLFPFLYRSFKYFKQVLDERRAIILNQPKAAGNVSKNQRALAVSNVSKGKDANISRERRRIAKDFPDKNNIEATRKPLAAIKTEEQKSESNIHDEVLSCRLNSKDHIGQIQAALKKAGFYKGEIDGEVGPQTKNAIKAFQKLKGLTSDGIVGIKTWEELKKYLKD